jgi:hypothetical protein
LLLHHAQFVLQAQQRAEHVGVDDGGAIVGRLPGQRPELPFGASVVDRYVQATEALDDLFDQTANLGFVAHVGVQVLRTHAHGAQFGGQCLAGFIAAARNGNAGAFAGEGQRAVARPMPVSAPVTRTTGWGVFMVACFRGGLQVRWVKCGPVESFAPAIVGA